MQASGLALAEDVNTANDATNTVHYTIYQKLPSEMYAVETNCYAHTTHERCVCA